MAAMTQLARLWEASANNPEHAIADGASRDPSEVETLRGCAYELRSTLSARRPGAQSAGTGPAPDKADPLGRAAVGDLDFTPDSPEKYCGQSHSLDGGGPWCTRSPHPDRWLHIAGDGDLVIAVWTDEPQPGSADS